MKAIILFILLVPATCYSQIYFSSKVGFIVDNNTADGYTMLNSVTRAEVTLDCIFTTNNVQISPYILFPSSTSYTAIRDTTSYLVYDNLKHKFGVIIGYRVKRAIFNISISYRITEYKIEELDIWSMPLTTKRVDGSFMEFTVGFRYYVFNEHATIGTSFNTRSVAFNIQLLIPILE